MSGRGLPTLLRHAGVHVLLVGVLGVLAAAIGGALRGMPVPIFHDEFAYLLTGDTFAHGRLANPSPASWQHFESLHVFMQPTMNGKYPPGQGLVIALGMVMGHPAYGVWLSIGALGAALTWMLQGWVPRRWALVGGVLAVIQFGPFGYWSQSYWGGAVAGTGGAIIFGALPRLLRRADARTGLVLGIGLAVLSISRPFEGLVVSLPVLGLLAWRRREAAVRIAVPVAVVMGLSLTATALHNHAVTGQALVLPYQHHERLYGVGQSFLFLAPTDRPEHANPRLAGYHHGWLEETYARHKTLAGWWARKRTDFGTAGGYLLGPALLLPLLLLPGARRRRSVRIAAVPIGLVLLGATVTIAVHPHYLAPALGPLWLLIVQGIRVAARPLRRIPAGALGVLLLLGMGAFLWKAWRPDPFLRFQPWRTCSTDRPRIAEELSAAGGKHVVFVRYAPGFDVHDEWVYNLADLASAPVIWAHDLGDAANAGLMRGRPDRAAWLVEVRPEEPRVTLTKYGR
jgi:hypothetical protein